MEPALILRMLTIFLTIAAGGRLVMAGMRFVTDRQPPAALATLHGFLASAAVTLLMYAAATVGLLNFCYCLLLLRQRLWHDQVTIPVRCLS